MQSAVWFKSNSHRETWNGGKPGTGGRRKNLGVQVHRSARGYSIRPATPVMLRNTTQSPASIACFLGPNRTLCDITVNRDGDATAAQQPHGAKLAEVPLPNMRYMLDTSSLPL